MWRGMIRVVEHIHEVAVVGRENHDRVLIQPEGLQRVE